MLKIVTDWNFINLSICEVITQNEVQYNVSNIEKYSFHNITVDTIPNRFGHNAPDYRGIHDIKLRPNNKKKIGHRKRSEEKEVYEGETDSQ